ncbi:MAG: hypothetical protein DRO23_01710 [Thermoprotei archaeon]|nr:MAG: hypothetical protein DRO23_01710 [Thermoprotei archaeon]
MIRLIIGFTIGSIAILADAWHAISDVLTSIGIYVAGKIASKPADREHPYGHGRVAVLAELFISAVLVLVSLIIVYEVFYGIFITEFLHEIAFYGIFFVIATAIAKELMARWTISLGKKSGSNLCIVNGLHHRLDALITLSISITLYIGIIFNIRVLDKLIALAVVAIIGFEAFKIAKKSIDTLMEKRIPEIEKLVAEKAAKHSKILYIHDVNARNLGGYYVVETTVHLAPSLTLKEAHKIAHELEEAVRKRNSKIIKLIIHIEPEGED